MFSFVRFRKRFAQETSDRIHQHAAAGTREGIPFQQIPVPAQKDRNCRVPGPNGKTGKFGLYDAVLYIRGLIITSTGSKTVFSRREKRGRSFLGEEIGTGTFQKKKTKFPRLEFLHRTTL